MAEEGDMLDLGRLLRLKGTVESAVSGVEIDWMAAPGLTESYNRILDEVRGLVEGTSLAEELERFPEIENYRERGPSPRAVAEGGSAAKRAASMLGQLAGWLDGLIQEQTLDQRLKYEAEERVKLERRKRPGFS